jgi:uncharacterized protein (DUF58 family)
MSDNQATLSPELFAQIKAIQLRTQHLVTDVLAGEYESAFKGRGMEFEEVREYQPGDDIRHIDWNVTARMSSPYIKEHREERELTVMLVVDVSSSGAFGSGDKLKHDTAAEVAAILAYTAIKSNDRVGLIIFNDRIEHYIPPKKGRAHVWRVIRDILTFKPARRGTDFDLALNYLNKVVRRRAVTFLISDFIDEHLSERLKVVAKRHDLTAISVSDPREHKLPPIGIIELEDAESGELITIDTRDPNIRNGFSVLGKKRRDQHRDSFRASGIGQIDIQTDSSPVDSLVRFFRSRERRSR